MPFAPITGGQIHYRLDGNQELPVLVLSNSLGTDLSMWDLQVRHSQNISACCGTTVTAMALPRLPPAGSESINSVRMSSDCSIIWRSRPFLFVDCPLAGLSASGWASTPRNV